MNVLFQAIYFGVFEFVVFCDSSLSMTYKQKGLTNTQFKGHFLLDTPWSSVPGLHGLYASLGHSTVSCLELMLTGQLLAEEACPTCGLGTQFNSRAPRIDTKSNEALGKLCSQVASCDDMEVYTHSELMMAGQEFLQRKTLPNPGLPSPFPGVCSTRCPGAQEMLLNSMQVPVH